RAYCLKTQPATGETYPKSDLFNKASTSDSSSQDPNAFLYELICNKTASHIEIFAKIVHEISFFSTNPGYKYSSAPQYSTALNLSPSPRTSDNGLKSLRPLATTLLNKENLA
ncbi:hypothetical protein, partial [Escherichia coli]|uniref:hypothetical protein n=1 Tax=Escherichia coli TaxID=562 RepID=UPI00203E92B1